MDPRLENLKTSVMNTWFPSDGKVFLNEDSTDSDDLVDIFFTSFLEQYKIAFPAVKAKVYSDYTSEDPLFLQTIDDKILRILGVTTQTSPYSFRYGTGTAVTGRNITNTNPTNVSPYMSEQAAMDLYTHITVDEWSGRMDKPIIMYDEASGDEFIQSNMSDFIIFYLSERTISVDVVPSSLYPSVEAYLLSNLAAAVLSALGRYPVSLAMADIGTTETPALDASNLSSVTIGGKLTLSLSSSAQKAYERLSELFNSGSGSKYMSDIESVHQRYSKIFDVLKYTRLNGISVS